LTRQQPTALDALLPLVALGTVADVVKLDANNRRLVAQGLRRVRAGALPPGMSALMRAASRETAKATTFDFGFALGPRINAAGRLADMTLGIECLLTDDAGRADELARQLDAINRERRVIEGDMREMAMEMAESLFDGDEPPPAICVFDPDFHEGVVGIVASRIKDKLHRPTFVFAASSAMARSTSSRLRPLDCRVSFARCARLGGQARTRACCCALAAMPWQRAAPLPKNTSMCLRKP
jgi:single-stranded-DNA-specific exonuclease